MDAWHDSNTHQHWWQLGVKIHEMKMIAVVNAQSVFKMSTFQTKQSNISCSESCVTEISQDHTIKDVMSSYKVRPQGHFSIKLLSYQCRKSHCGYKMILLSHVISPMRFAAQAKYHLHRKFYFLNLFFQMVLKINNLWVYERRAWDQLILKRFLGPWRSSYLKNEIP